MLSNYSPPFLNDYVLEDIISIVCDVAYPTLQSLLLTSHRFYSLVFPFLYRYIGINLENDEFMDEIHSWLADRERSPTLKVIRRISIYGNSLGIEDQELYTQPFPHHLRVIGRIRTSCISADTAGTRASRTRKTSSMGRDSEYEWATIAVMISSTTQLRAVTFACPEAMPMALIQSIHNYPTLVYLDLAFWTREPRELLHEDPAELELLGSPSLISLRAHIYNTSRNSRDLRLPAFWRLVRSSPNLRTVMLQISHGGCVVPWDTPAEIRKWELLASAFKRTIVRDKDRVAGIRNLRVNGIELSEFEDKELSNAVNLDCQFLPLEILQSLTSLAHLTLRREYGNDQSIDELLIACPPLTSLHIVEWSACLQLGTILTRHGSSLRALTLHEFERIRTDPSKARSVLSPEQVLQIKDGCPHLEELSIDLNFPEDPLLESEILETDVHEEFYEAVAKFTHLRKLHLNFNLGISTYNKQRLTVRPGRFLPLADETFVRMVWKTVDRSTLRELRVSQGEARLSMGHGYPASWVLWEQSRHCWFKVMRSERDDEPEKIIVSSYRGVSDFTEDIWRDWW